jgi:GxxExxY protein
MERDALEKIATRVLDAAFEVHRHLGPGLLESTYEMALCHELSRLGLPFERQKDMPVRYKGVHLDCGYRLDLVVDGEVLVELKAIDALPPVHEAQLLTYLKLADRYLGLLINFNVPLLKQGIKRLVNRLDETSLADPKQNLSGKSTNADPSRSSRRCG